MIGELVALGYGEAIGLLILAGAAGYLLLRK